MKQSCKVVAACLSGALLSACGGSGAFSPSLSGAGALPTDRRLVSAEPLAGESVLYAFTGAPNAAFPYSGLLAGKHNEFYGVSNGGGTVGPSGLLDGTVYEVSSTGQERVLYDFQGGNDGGGSEAGLIADRAGNLFGATQVGGGSSACTNGCGVVFEMQPNGSGFTERVLHAFQGGSDGELPLASLLLGKHGVLYGTTSFGGGSGCSGPSGFAGCGTVFSLTPSGSGYTEKIVYSFQGGTDGATPRDQLVADSKGVLYGTTEFGGKTKSACDASPSGNTTCGTVFKLTPSGNETILYRFDGGKRDGSNPRSALLLASNGSLFGLTVFGGAATLGAGTAYELTPYGKRYSERVIHFFGQGSVDGARPYDPEGLTADSSGNLYGTTLLSTVSPCGCGTVFELSPTASGYGEKLLHVFAAAGDGALPYGSVTLRKNVIYGTTYEGGGYCYGSSYSCGVVYKVRL
ncbi:MAG: choice-of-anchor tandem repeat GloVer-containing protein [Candidatus Cybelea sp.]